jgi:hypothetical protein
LSTDVVHGETTVSPYSVTNRSFGRKQQSSGIWLSR